MSRARRRADRIREEIPIQQVLSDYGYRIEAGYDGEQQFSCDLHGDGQDNKPSARVYPDSASWYCFACDRTRDSIQTVREKEGMDFWPAVKALEGRYGLPTLPWEDDDEAPRARPPSAEQAVQTALQTNKSYEEVRKRVERLLENTTKDRDLPMRTTLSLWEALDKTDYLVRKERLPEAKAKGVLLHLHQRVMDKLAKAAGV
jgi:DNA primase